MEVTSSKLEATNRFSLGILSRRKDGVFTTLKPENFQSLVMLSQIFSSLPVDEILTDQLEDFETTPAAESLIPPLISRVSETNTEFDEVSVSDSNTASGSSASSSVSSTLSPSSASSESTTVPPVSVTDVATLAEPEQLGHGLRPKKQQTKLADYILTSLMPSVTPYPLDNYVSSAQFSMHYQAYINALTTTFKPLYYKDAVEDENW